MAPNHSVISRISQVNSWRQPTAQALHGGPGLVLPNRTVETKQYNQENKLAKTTLGTRADHRGFAATELVCTLGVDATHELRSPVFIEFKAIGQDSACELLFQWASVYFANQLFVNASLKKQSGTLSKFGGRLYAFCFLGIGSISGTTLLRCILDMDEVGFEVFSQLKMLPLNS